MLAVSSTFAELEDQRLADLAKSLAHPARIRILRLLLATPGCIGGDIVNFHANVSRVFHREVSHL